MNDNGKVLLAEFIGTFTLVFIGAGTGTFAGTSGAGLVGVALAHGVALMVIVYAWGSVSGAHVNPAVTFGIALTGRMSWGKAVSYWGAQFLGGIVAAYLLAFLVGDVLGPNPDLGSTRGVLSDKDPVHNDVARTIIVEAVLTFFLLIAVFASGVGAKSGNAAGLAIGFVLMMDILMGGYLTGASMNPARTLGPALAMQELTYFWMYFVGPLLGGGLAAVLYNMLYLPPVQPAAAESPKQSSRRTERG